MTRALLYMRHCIIPVEGEIPMCSRSVCICAIKSEGMHASTQAVLRVDEISNFQLIFTHTLGEQPHLLGQRM